MRQSSQYPHLLQPPSLARRSRRCRLLTHLPAARAETRPPGLTGASFCVATEADARFNRGRLGEWAGSGRSRFGTSPGRTALPPLRRPTGGAPPSGGGRVQPIELQRSPYGGQRKPLASTATRCGSSPPAAGVPPHRPSAPPGPILPIPAGRAREARWACSDSRGMLGPMRSTGRQASGFPQADQAPSSDFAPAAGPGCRSAADRLPRRSWGSNALSPPSPESR